MPGELLIDAGPGEWRAAWLEEDEARELYVERGETKPPGSRHLGRVVRVVPALDAAQVDIGDERPGFLPLRDVPTGIRTDEGAQLVVEVRREAWQDKAPRLTAKLAQGSAPIASGRAPPVQLFPQAGLGAALALRLPEAPQLVVADDPAVIPELRSAFPEAEIGYRPAADWPVDLDALFEAALAPSLSLARGGSVHFAETRAATVIDVDTGTPTGGTAVRAALAANRAAAAVIARELRRRNIGGAVVIDFVGLDRRQHRDEVRRALEATLAGDPAQPQLLGWTRLGHLELLRPRRGRSLADAMLIPAIPAFLPIAAAHATLRAVLREARANPAANWRLTVPQPVAAALRGPAASALATLETRLGRRIALQTDEGREGFDIAAI